MTIDRQTMTAFLSKLRESDLTSISHVTPTTSDPTCAEIRRGDIRALRGPVVPEELRGRYVTVLTPPSLELANIVEVALISFNERFAGLNDIILSEAEAPSPSHNVLQPLLAVPALVRWIGARYSALTDETLELVQHMSRYMSRDLSRAGVQHDDDFVLRAVHIEEEVRVAQLISTPAVRYLSVDLPSSMESEERKANLRSSYHLLRLEDMTDRHQVITATRPNREFRNYRPSRAA